MSIRDIIEGKKKWRAHVKRVKELPQDYQIVYNEIEKYLFKVGPAELTKGIGLLSEIVDFFKEESALGKGALEATGSDVAAFCDNLVEDSKTYVEIYQESAGKEVNKAIKKLWIKQSKRDFR
jgi:DNA-binding ferritin-like protein (Dps family)